jgi:HEAT repeats
MPERRGAGRRVAGILGCAAVLAATIIGIKLGFFGAKRGGMAQAGAAIDEHTPLATLAEAVRGSDHRALAEIDQRLANSPDAPKVAFSEDEASGWIQVLTALRTGFLGFKGAGRIVTVGAAGRIFDRFAIDPAPAQWADALAPLHDLLTASLADSDPNLRAAALDQITDMWVWLPGRSLTPAEETALVKWKENIYRPVVRCLGNRDARTLVAAVKCLGTLPVDNAAAPALAYIDNPHVEVRQQTLVSFARRNLILTDDMLLTRLHDADPLIRTAVTSVLKTRGLSEEQIHLGGLIFSPKPQQRLSVIPRLKDRTDVDPAIWLIQLSRDSEEMVRLSAIEAMGGMKSPSVQRRLKEMARSDLSDAVRKAAGKLVPPARERTASLPPPPGSPNLNPRAN